MACVIRWVVGFAFIFTVPCILSPSPAQRPGFPERPVQWRENNWKENAEEASPPHALARLGTVCFRHSSSVTAITFSPNGKEIASLEYSPHSGVSLWEVRTGRLLR